MSQIAAYAHGGPALRGLLRVEPEDFQVEERLGFEPTGSGEHAFLWVEKRRANTPWVAEQLAQAAGVDVRNVGYAGLKDRHALTRQYFSVHLPGKPGPDWLNLGAADFRVLTASRHKSKLPRGALLGNRFRLRIRSIQGDRDLAQLRMRQIASAGVPNGFGEQRFGHGGGNLDKAAALFRGRRFGRAQRGMLLSAARSAIFNAVLAERIESASWNQALAGDVFQLDGRGSIFGPLPIDASILERLEAGEIHPTGPLWGSGERRATDLAAAIEERAVAALPELAAGLLACEISAARRALRVIPRHFSQQWLAPDTLEIGFELPAGSYATSVLRELVDYSGALEDSAESDD